VNGLIYPSPTEPRSACVRPRPCRFECAVKIFSVEPQVLVCFRANFLSINEKVDVIMTVVKTRGSVECVNRARSKSGALIFMTRSSMEGKSYDVAVSTFGAASTLLGLCRKRHEIA
jgi:hypothetical protein